MFHVIAYEEAVGTAANTQLDPIVDRVLRSDGEGFVPDKDIDVIFAHVRGPLLNRSRIVAPSLRLHGYPWIRPINRSIDGQAQPFVADYRDNPFRLRRLEQVTIEHTSGIAMGTEQHLCVLGVTWHGTRPAPRGQIVRLRGTNSAAATALVWTQGTITWSDTLPEGVYAVVGLEAQGTDLVAARLIFEDQVSNPGCIAIDAIGDRTHDMFGLGGLGEWGRFTAFRFPNVEFLAHTASTPAEVYIDVVKVA